MEQAFYARTSPASWFKLACPRPRCALTCDDRFLRRGGQLKPSWYGTVLPSRDFPMLVDLYLKGASTRSIVSETIALATSKRPFIEWSAESLRSVVVM